MTSFFSLTEPYVKRLVTTVENEQNVQLKLFKMPTDMPTDAGIEYIHQAVEKGLDDVADKTNNVVICAPNNTLTILEQVLSFQVLFYICRRHMSVPISLLPLDYLRFSLKKKGHMVERCVEGIVVA